MSFKKNFFFSIITITKNNSKGLEKTLKSLLKQNFKNFELIIIDGKSTDRTSEIVKKYKRNIKIYISEKDTGIYNAMNKGIKLAKGKIIGILNSGDEYYPNALKTIYLYQKKFKKVDLFFGSVKKSRVMSGFHPSLIKWKFNIFPGHSSGFFVRSWVHKKYGLYNERFKFSSDHDFIYRMIVNKKLRGISTKKNELVGKFDSKGISGRLSFYRTLKEEIIIRYENNQNVLFLLFLIIIKIINKIKNVIFPKFRINEK